VSVHRIWAVTRKEFRHILRDRGTLFLVALMPVLLLFLLAYAVTADIRNVPVAVLDLDRTPTSRDFIQQIAVGQDLDLVAQIRSWDEIEGMLMREQVKAAVVLGPGFERQLFAMQGMPLQVIIDGTEPESGGFAVDHIGRRAEEFATRLLADHLAAQGIAPDALTPIDLRVRVWFNPNLKNSIGIVPGLISIVLGLPGMSIALTLAREHEHGTMEQLMATPIGRAELLLGKMLPYVAAGLLNVPLTTAAGMLVFHIPFHGNFGLFMGLSALFFFALLSLNILVGVLLRSQAAALALSMLLVFYPGFFLMGIFFPISSMPPIVLTEAYSLPGTHYAVIARALFVRGVGMEVLWPYAAGLFALGVVFTALAALFFQKKLA